MQIDTNAIAASMEALSIKMNKHLESIPIGAQYDIHWLAMNEEFSQLHEKLLRFGVTQEWIIDNITCPES